VPVAVVLAWLVVGACSASPDRPPELGKCEFEDASCPATTAGGGAQGGEEGDANTACSVNPADSQCAQCQEASCCPSLNACSESMDCQNLVDCEEACTGAGNCIPGYCESKSPNGVSPLATLTACIQANCAVCSQLGVGDPCNPFAPACNPGLVCNGLWCTKACVRSTDCGGLGAGGGNQLGLPNACIVTSTAGEECQPGCTQDADCSTFPGAFCFATTSSDGLSVRVCVSPPDAGAD
jgi:hypothetical protein